jgi:hypothetical protein
MVWYKPILDQLRAGRTTTLEQRGFKMFNHIRDGQIATLAPPDGRPFNFDDLVFVYCQGNYLIRLIAAIDGNRFLIADSHGKLLDWVDSDAIHGKVIAVSTPDDLFAKLTIDGNETSPFEVCILSQSDPYPGGHNYHWLIPRRLVGSGRFHSAKFSTCHLPKQDQSHSWLFWLESILQDWACNLATERQLGCDFPADYRFFLNAVESLTVTKDQLIVDGICSPAVRSG